MAVLYEYCLTTKDNPYDPFDNFDEWLSFDNRMGYGTPQYLARIAKTSPSLSETEYNEEVKRSIEEIVRLDPFDLYRIVRRKVSEDKD